jgi:hypothetical protein
MGPCRREDNGNSKPAPLNMASDDGDHRAGDPSEDHNVHHQWNNPQQRQLQQQQITDPETIDPQRGQQEAWAAAEGYTPLADWSLRQPVPYDHRLPGGGDGGGGSAAWMVSMGPQPSSGEGGSYSEDGDDPDEGGDEPPSYRGAFFVNPSAFDVSSAGDDDREEDEKSSVDETTGETSAVDYSTNRNRPPSDIAVSNFEDVAAKALLALDDEYQQVVSSANSIENEASWTGSTNPHRNSARKELDDVDSIKIIAAAFDRRNEEIRRMQQQGGFPVDWDGISSGTTNNNGSGTKKQDDTPVDTDAVKRAVNELWVKNKNNPFQQKFAAWQKQQQEKKKMDSFVPPVHELIPPPSLKAFAKSTMKAKRATATLTRSATLAEAIVRVLLSKSSTSASHSLRNNRSLLLIDVVGVDHVECASIRRVQDTFRPVIRWLGARTDLPYRQVHFRLIGRELSVEGEMCEGVPVDLLPSQSMAPLALNEAVATCHVGIYHEFLEHTTTGTGKSTSPDLLVAFNAGVWGYKEWETTIGNLAQRTPDGSSTTTMSPIPMVITAYTLEECQEDHEVIAKVTKTVSSNDGTGKQTCCSKILWGPEENHFGSMVIRETKSSNQVYRENAYWQAWLLGGLHGHCD